MFKANDGALKQRCSKGGARPSGDTWQLCVSWSLEVTSINS